MRNILFVVCACLVAYGPAFAQSKEPLPVIAPPESFFGLVRERDREVARAFYKKYLDVDGMPVVAGGDLDDVALRRTHEIVTHLLAGRPDVLKAMVDTRMYLIIIGKDQVYTDMPEYRNHPDPAFQNERVRGTGGRPTSFGEENLLSLPLDRYDDESIAVHEFCHTIDGALRAIDPGWTARRNAAYQNAIAKGRYRDAYASGNPGEYWAEIAQSYFDCNRVNNWNHGPIGTREQLRLYDPEGYALARDTFKLAPHQDWRYTWIQRLPNVTVPPSRLRLDPYYTRFTWAREFTVVGKEASDEALLKANDTIRKLFAYRHDILKALIADGLKLVVLGPGESIADLPEFRDFQNRDIDPIVRFLDDGGDVRTLVVAQENVLADPADPRVGPNQVIRVLARSLYRVTGTRPVDPNWENRGRSTQQYELRVKRLDVRFGERVEQLYDSAMKQDRWRGTAASINPAEYWASGVLAYFDAQGQEAAPPGAAHPIRTREALEKYDPKLYALVHETMAYQGHVDWRFQAAPRR
jgi:alpha-glucosidase